MKQNRFLCAGLSVLFSLVFTGCGNVVSGRVSRATDENGFFAQSRLESLGLGGLPKITSGGTAVNGTFSILYR